jgi:hypothetical protein
MAIAKNMSDDWSNFTFRYVALALIGLYVGLNVVRSVYRAFTSPLRHLPGPW